jgi:Protein of unknown function (DUF3224)
MKMKRTTGTIEMRQRDATPFDSMPKGTTLQLVQLTEEFFGEVSGILTARFIQVVTADGLARQWGAGRLVGTVAGRRGSFAIQDAGSVRGDKVEGTWSVISGSGSDELSGLRGNASFKGTIGQPVSYAFEYAFE